MQKTLIITEKPSVAREYARILKVNGNKPGYIENEHYIITWCVGHLVTMSYPEKYNESLKKWNLDDLPFLPEKYKYEVIQNVREQYKIVKECLNRKDITEILWAGDSGREGQYIEALIRDMAGVNKNCSEKRIWIDSCTEEEILKGIKNAKPMSSYDTMSSAGYMRAIEDYSIGINFSRALTLKHSYALKKVLGLGPADKAPIAVGRVMTCVLGMVVEREREIKNFVETPFYKITGYINNLSLEWKATEGSDFFNSPLLYKINGFKNKTDAENFVKELSRNPFLKVSSIEKKIEKKGAPSLFSLAELQNECSKRYKISPDETLEVAQSLYEKKLTTYPRTDARVLSTAITKVIDDNIKKLESNSDYKDFVEKIISSGSWKTISASKKYVDDSKVTDHYAIIPTGEGNISSLTPLEKNVYDIIVRRFLSIFFPSAEFIKISITANNEREKFYTSGTALKSLGYLEIVGYDEKPEDRKIAQELNTIKEADYPAKFMVTEGKTNPPVRYNSGSMILAMENAGQLIEDEELRAQIKGCGIGTSATRGDTLKKLVKNKYLNLNTKTQILSPAPMGEGIYDVVSDALPSLLSPKLTASWEKGLDQVSAGQISKDIYQKKLNDYIKTETEKIKASNEKNNFGDYGKVGNSNSLNLDGLKCPCCGMELKETPFGIGCSGYKKEDPNSCKFSIGKIAGKTLTSKQIKQLITEKKTTEISGFKSKSGKTFSAALKLVNGNIQFDFPEQKVEKSGLKCPKCNSLLNKEKYSYKCDCGYKIAHTIAGKTLNEKEMSNLLSGGTDELSGFVSKTGKKFTASLIADQEGKVSFVFKNK